MFKKKPTQPVGRTRAPQPNRRSNGPVFSYHANRGVRMGSTVRDMEEPARQEMPRPKRFAVWLKRVPTLAGLLIILILTGAMLQLSSNAKVKVVGDSQTFLRDIKVYEDAAHKAFTPVFNSNKLTVNAGRISTDLQEQFPELKVVSVSLPVVGNQPIVYIQPAEPKIILVAKGGMYLLSGDGRAMITANQVTDLGKLKIPVVNDQSGLSIELGHVALPKDTVSFITEVVGQMRAKGVAVTSLDLPAGTNELHMKMDGVGYYVKFNLHGDAREEAGAYLAMKEYLESSHKTPGEYVDVRVENRAYYK
jgi:cell division septal protein FtsQ